MTEPASIRYKNPGAMWGNAIAVKWGASPKAVMLSDGKGQGNNIAVFPTYVQGICAQLDLWRTSKNYRNKSFAEAIAIWSGGNDVESYIAFVQSHVPGLSRNTIMDDVFWRGPMGVEFLKAQAWHEAGQQYPASDADWLDAQITVFGDIASSKKERPDDPKYLKAAFSDLGLSEIIGPLHEPRVLAMYKNAGHPEVHDDETSWCAAAVGNWLVIGGLKPSGSLMARSYETWGFPCDLRKPIPRGAIIVWPYGVPPHGHVNICLEDDGTYLTCIGGNQSNGKGGGVTISHDKRSIIVSARLPDVQPASAQPASRKPTEGPTTLSLPNTSPTPQTQPVKPARSLLQALWGLLVALFRRKQP